MSLATSRGGLMGMRAVLLGSAMYQGLTLAHFRAQLEDLRDGNTSLTLELNLSTFGTHPRLMLDYMGDTVRLS
jgi:hypothetical protein